MKQYVCLLRGINVGGHHKLPMKELSRILESLGLSNIRTYIQSGNVVFSYPKAAGKKLESKISSAIESKFGFNPKTLLLSESDFRKAIQSSPIDATGEDPKSIHLYFLDRTPKQIDWQAIEERKSKNEAYFLVGNVFYFHAPDGIARSKLAASIESLLGVPGTGRNWRTATKIASMLDNDE